MWQEILDKYYAAERQINSYQKGIQHQLGIMRGLIQRLDGRRKRSVHSPTAAHSGYAADEFPDAEPDSSAARYDMPTHSTEQVPDTPIRHPPIIGNILATFITALVVENMSNCIGVQLTNLLILQTNSWWRSSRTWPLTFAFYDCGPIP